MLESGTPPAGRSATGAILGRSARTSTVAATHRTSDDRYGAPAERADEGRHDCDGQAAAARGRPAVEALRERPAAGAADEREPGDERDAGAEPGDRPARDAEREVVARHRDEVAGADEHRRDEDDAERAEAVARAACGDLHPRVGDEQRGREQPDRGEAHAVRAREVGGDPAEVPDVPAEREAEDAPGDRPPQG